jgi:putative oxygen-independent coproporphyrinogen III oxidase
MTPRGALHLVDSTAAADDADLGDGAAAWRSAYVHVPFCRRRCPYCDFAVVAEGEGGVGDPVSRYVEALLAEIAMEEPWGPLDAVALGGGTPSTLTGAQLASILGGIRERHGIAAEAEISVEVNPEDWSDRYAEELLGAGFTRLSFGVQSFDPAVLAALGRLHTADQGAACVAAARRAGFRSVSLDLIFGAPCEDGRSWANTVDRALSLGTDHLSAYALTVERGTELSRLVAAGAPAPDPDGQADRYEHLERRALVSGLIRYEVSNWARPGHACRYNLSTWAQGEYLGFGLGAHDHRDGSRSRNQRRLDRYIEAVTAGSRPRAGSETSGPWEREQERLMLGLRRVCGVAAGECGARLVASDEGERLVDAGVLAIEGARLRVAKPLLTDAVVRAVLSLSPGDC